MNAAILVRVLALLAGLLPVAAQAAEWKSSREDLETTRRDVNARMSSYEETVNNLLG